ncbi:uncharacterized protein LOC136025567 isoform X3 [Artemia franciscana]|uniref:uncharacterized protein LOC136025567 isoform X3 n=1 Tax=Artemia franciscana TaxID=6661 RepID=UPI0032DBEAE3
MNVCNPQFSPIKDLDDTMTRMEKLLAIADMTDKSSNFNHLLGISSKATKGMDISISISTAYETPRGSLNSVPFESFLSVSPSLPGATKEEPEDEQVVSSVGRLEEMKPIHSEKNCIPLENEKPNVNTPVVEKFSTPVSTPLRWKNSVKKEKTNPQHLKTACPMPVQSTLVTYKTPPTTPHFTNSAKKASSSHSKPRTPSSMTKKVAQKLETFGEKGDWW